MITEEQINALEPLKNEIEELLKHQLSDGQREMIITAWWWALYEEGILSEILG